MKKLVFMLSLAASLCLVAVEETAYAPMKEALAPYVESGELPGAVSILFKDGRRAVTCVGYADVAAKRAITADDTYMQCSQTKGFCGVTIAKLVEEGRLNLDDPVSKYLPEFETLWIEGPATNDMRTLIKAKNVLTVRMCLNHTGGFPFETSAKSNLIKGGGWSGGAWGTNCMVNWRKRELKLWAVQLNGGPRPWDKARDAAAERFFGETIDSSEVDAYTGRVK